MEYTSDAGTRSSNSLSSTSTQEATTSARFRRRIGSGWVALISVVCVGLLACQTPEDNTGSGDDEVKSASNTWELAQLCDGNVTRHTAVREQELSGGVARWQCGDRKDLDANDALQQFGQEYCEYFAVNAGKRVDRLSEVDKSKPVSCFYTSVYADVDSNLATDKRLATALSSKENFGAKFSSDLVRMQNGVNSRKAATALIADSASLAQDKNSPKKMDHLRTAACFLAAKSGNDAAKAACERIDLSNDDNWQKAQDAGVKVATAADAAAFEQQQDLYACMAVKRLQGGGVDWRMSDPHITEIAVRATSECGCQYTALPSALHGFSMGTWTSAEQLPPGCRRAKVDGNTGDENLLTICDITPEMMSDLELDSDHSDNLQKFCNDTFGDQLVLTAPLRVVEVPGSCTKTESTFCKGFVKTAKK